MYVLCALCTYMCEKEGKQMYFQHTASRHIYGLMRIEFASTPQYFDPIPLIAVVNQHQ